MKHLLALGILLMLSHPSSQGQSTWSDLHFGMSKTEAGQALKGKGMTMIQRNADVFSVQPTYQVSLPDLEKPLPFKPELTLNAKGLQEVDLQLDTDELLKRIGSPYAMVDITNSSMRKALIAKYGPPFEEKGSCTSTGNQLVDLLLKSSNVECKSSWRGDKQLISASWWYEKSQPSFHYFLSYQASSPDL